MAGLGDFLRASGQMAGRNIAAGPEFVLSRLMEPSTFRTLSPMQQLAVVRGDYKAFLRAGGKGSGLAPAVGRAAVERDFVLVPDELVRRPVFDMIPRPTRALSVPPQPKLPDMDGYTPIYNVDPATGNIITDSPIQLVPSNERGALSLLDPGFRGYQARVGRRMVDQYGPGALRGALDDPGSALSVPQPGAAGAGSDSVGLAALLAAAGAGIAGMQSVTGPQDYDRKTNIPEQYRPFLEPLPEVAADDIPVTETDVRERYRQLLEPLPGVATGDIPVTVQDGMPVFALPGGFGGYEDNLPLTDDPSATAMLAAETSQLPSVTAEASDAEVEAEARIAELLPYIGEENARLVRYHIQSGGSYQDALSAMLKAVR